MSKPDNLGEILHLSEKLSAQFNFVRIDFFSDGKVCKVGEITHCTAAAIGPFNPVEYEKIVSDLIFSP